MAPFATRYARIAKSAFASKPIDSTPLNFGSQRTSFACFKTVHAIAPGGTRSSSAVPSSTAGFKEGPRGGSGPPQESMFEVDWSIFSHQSLSQGLKDLLLDLMGIAPPPPPNPYSSSAWIRKNAALGVKIEQLYAQQRLQDVSERGYLVKGLIYDISALTCSVESVLQNSGSKRDSARARARTQEDQKLFRAQQAMHDWEGFVVGHVADPLEVSQQPSSAPPPGEPGAEGGGAIGAVSSRKSRAPGPDASPHTLIHPTPVPLKPVRGDTNHQKTGFGSGIGASIRNEKEFEEVLGRGDSVRSKYEGRLREMRILADARQEGDGAWQVAAQGRKGMGNLQLRMVKSDREWVTMPGAATLLRHFRERGVQQGAVLNLPPAHISHLQDEIGSFRFTPTQTVTPSAPLSRKSLKDMCKEWGLEPKQVMMVIGPGKSGLEIRKAAANLGFFICKLNNSHNHSPNSTSETSGLLPGESSSELESGSLGLESKSDVGRDKNGLLGWYSRLAEGTLHVENESGTGRKESIADVHFSVGEVRELKLILEELNGVSYRKSVFMRNQDKREALTPAIVIKPVRTQTLELKPA